ncbi:oligopeptide ABC transporter, substrate binding protein [Lacticaseibacillus thailandensis DSM 22698 = JCM 13996]|uniref:Oligopeptide ABC transporter, substrate binding protein n=2 Tax=Lacticaseibacillus thailandensis TaxID=381741 RepID=A0A0R2C6G4_9LACO|nr:oligopeptide ABC transporter, substrate binding protein [Lacticaseibacillus thailandensis DSM 22698 = JCM 13996]
MKTMSKVFGIIAAVGLSGVALSACGQKAAAASNQNISVGIASEIQMLDPVHDVDTTSSEIIGNTEEGLVTMGKQNKAEPGIAKSWTKSKDGLTYTFNLRHDAKWNDGTPVTAQDFVYGWRRGVDPKTAAENAYLFSGIKNADAIIANKKDPDQLGIQANGKYQVTVTLEHPISYFEQLVQSAIFLPQEQKVVQKYGKKYGTDATKVAYDGPYTIKKWNGSGDSWTLTKNNHYWNPNNVHLNQVTYQVVKESSTGLNMFESGQIDQTTLIGNQVQNEKNNKSYTKVASGSNYFVQLNQKSPSSTILKKAFNNVDIRKALSLSIDRQSFVNNTLNDGSTAALGIVTTGMGQNPSGGEDFAKAAYVKNDADSGVNYNIALAKQLWAKGMKEIGATSLNVTLTADDDDTHDTIVQYLQNAWTKNLKGMRVTVRKVPKTTRVKYLQTGNFDAIISGWSPDYSDPSTFLDMFTTGNSYNFGDYSNSKFDADMKTADNTADAKTRWNAMVNAEQTLMKDQGVIPLYQLSTSYLRNTKLKNVIINPAGGNPGWRGVYLANK